MTQFIKSLIKRRINLPAAVRLIPALLLATLLPALVQAQSTFLPQGSKFDHFLERMEILQQTDPDLNISTNKPISRRLAVRVAQLADSLYKFYPYDYIDHISTVDRTSLSSLQIGR